MNKQAILHKPESEYAYALNERTLRIVLRVARGESLEGVKLICGMKYTFTKARNETPMQKEYTDELFDYYFADIELSDVRFAYIFAIKENGKTWYYSEAGIEETYDFEYAYYTFFQYAYINAADVAKVVPWAYKAVFYQIFIDRFCRGDFEKKDGYINQDWNAPIHAKSFTGGDLNGITSKLDYLSALGINALYLTPIFCSNSNHKYNVEDYLQADAQFGTNKDMLRLLEEAHRRGMKVIVDTVFNHCDEKHPYFRDVMEKGRKSAYYDWFMIRGEKPDKKALNYECFADCGYMPKWNTNHAKVQEYLTQTALTYVKDWGFDGLRLDVSDEVSHTFWRKLRMTIKDIKPDAVLLGEIWHENEAYLRGEQFDGVMNYKLQKILIDYFAAEKISAREASERLCGLWVKNRAQVNYMMLNFLDNHDTPRFLRFAGGDKNRVLAALAGLMLYPGMPCVFYGTELPLDGAGDPDCRRTFDWTFESQDKNYAEKVRELFRLKEEQTIQTGAFSAYERNGLLAIERTGRKERVTGYFNRTEKKIVLSRSGTVLFENGCEGEKILPEGAKIIMETIQ